MRSISGGVVQCLATLQEEFEDNKGAIRILISQKKRQSNGQRKKYKRTNNDLQNIHMKLKFPTTGILRNTNPYSKLDSGIFIR